jgi:hypothetical protein
MTFIQVKDVGHKVHAFEQIVNAFSENSLLQEAVFPAVALMRPVVRVENVEYLGAIEKVKKCPPTADAIDPCTVLPLASSILLVPTPHIKLHGLSPTVRDTLDRLLLIRDIPVFNMLPPVSD